MFRRGPGRLEMCFYAYKNVLEPMGHLGANLIFSILTLNQVRKARGGWTPTYFTQARKRQKKDDIQVGAATLARVTGGGYDHRDGGHARRKRKRLFDDGDRRAGKAGRHR